MEPRIQYAMTSDGVSIAYAVIGEGPPIVIASTAFGGINLYSAAPVTQLIDLLAEQGWRLITYDGRGMGSSDRGNTDYELEARLGDLGSVIERTGIDRFALYGGLDAGPLAIAYAAGHPDRVSHLVLQGTYARGTDYFEVIPALRAARAIDTMAEEQWEYYTLALANALTGFSDSETARKYAAAFRAGMSARAFVAYRDAGEKVDVTDILSGVSAPTLVLHLPSNPLSNVDLLRVLASRIPNARLVSTGEQALAIVAFLREGGEPTPEEAAAPAAGPDAFRTILFTDMVGSASLSQRLGDAAAQKLRRAHNKIVREALAGHGGTETKHTGDGIMAAFASVSGAVACAVAIQQAVAEADADADAAQHSAQLRVRVGLNAGEPIAEEQDLFGTTVDLAARLRDMAEPGEILVSDVVRQLVAGKGFLFNDRGEHALKGFEDPVRVWEVRWSE